ncbi:uncharacterized protein [Antedon mediterranea]|uniref:uncharacterized protein n=1 Tax=Antedon mediterranea TaxID=105859 RepID=UPI003AF464FA
MYQFEDSSRNTAFCSFYVHVSENEPEITFPDTTMSPQTITEIYRKEENTPSQPETSSVNAQSSSLSFSQLPTTSLSPTPFLFRTLSPSLSPKPTSSQFSFSLLSLQLLSTQLSPTPISSHFFFKPSVSQLTSPSLTPTAMSSQFAEQSSSSLPSPSLSPTSLSPQFSEQSSSSLPSPLLSLTPMSSTKLSSQFSGQSSSPLQSPSLPSTPMSSQFSGQSSSQLPPPSLSQTPMSSQFSGQSSLPLSSPSLPSTTMSSQFSGQSSSQLPSPSLPSTTISSQFSGQSSSPFPSPSLPPTTISSPTTNYQSYTESQSYDLTLSTPYTSSFATSSSSSVVPFKSHTTLHPFISLASTSSPSTILVQSSSPLVSSTLNSLPTTTVVTKVDTPATNGSVTAEDDIEQKVTKARPSQQFTFTAEQLTTERRAVHKKSTIQQQTTGWPSEQTTSFDEVSPEVITSSILTVSGQMTENEEGALNKSNSHDNSFSNVLIVCLCLLFMAVIVIAGILFKIKGRKVQQKYYFQPKHGENKDKEPPSVDICDLRPLNKDAQTIQKDDGILNCAYNNDSKV